MSEPFWVPLGGSASPAGTGASGGYVILTPGSAALSDGSTGNAAPGLTRRKGTEASAPQKHYLTLDFDPSTAEYAWWTFPLPARYTPAGAIRLELSWQANAIANSCVWAARLGAITPADVDTFPEHVPAAATTVTTATDTTEARRLNRTTITLANLDSVAPADLVTLVLYRDAAGAGDTLTVDAELLAVTLEFA